MKPDTLVLITQSASQSSRDWLPLWTGLIGALVGIVASVVASRTSTKIAEAQIKLQSDSADRQLRASVLAGNRIRWIEQLRNEVASFLAVSAALASDIIAGIALPKLHEKIDLMMEHSHTIALMTNPAEPSSQDLNAAIEQVELCINEAQLKRSLSNDEADRHLTLVRTRAQAILKAEWERVKLLN